MFLNIQTFRRALTITRKKNGKKGRKPSSVTAIAEETVDNKVVVEDITELLSKEFVDYGYIKVSKYLKQNNYNINKKKVYRLMKENNLLHKQRIKPKSGRQFVKFRKVTVDKPFSFMEMDIKYVHIKGLHINVFLLTVLDVFLRMALGYCVFRLHWTPISEITGQVNPLLIFI